MKISDYLLSNRDKSVDIAKGIGIILVVWGHTFGCCPVMKEIDFFHMPLFFFVAGFFLPEYISDKKTIPVQESKNLIYSIFVLLCMLYCIQTFIELYQS